MREKSFNEELLLTLLEPELKECKELLLTLLEPEVSEVIENVKAKSEDKES